MPPAPATLLAPPMSTALPLSVCPFPPFTVIFPPSSRTVPQLSMVGPLLPGPLEPCIPPPIPTPPASASAEPPVADNEPQFSPHIWSLSSSLPHRTVRVVPSGTFMAGAPALLVPPEPPVRMLLELWASVKVSIELSDSSMALVALVNKASSALAPVMLTPFSVMEADAPASTTMRSLVGVVAPLAMEMVRFAPSLTVSTPLEYV